MTDKTTPLAEAVARITSGSTVMVGGFGLPGTPMTLVAELFRQGQDDLTLIKNEANEPGMGISLIIEAGRLRKLVLSHLGLNTKAIAMMNAGELDIEFHPQGILAEKIRCGGAGLLGFVTDIGVDTIIAENRQVMDVDGTRAIFEPCLRADVALVHAARADRYGNLVYTRTARNFNPLMAQAADLVIAEAAEVVDVGEMDPDHVHTPGVFVDHVVDLGGLDDSYGVLEHHVV